MVVTWINRALGLPRRLGSLIAVGTSICGVSAIVATGPAIDAEEDEVSYAVACVTLFGLVALFTYPFLAHAIFGGDARKVGLFLGTAIHDTAQVAGAGLMYREQYRAPEALDTATVVKLTRNLCMAGVIPLMAALYHRGGGPDGRARGRSGTRSCPCSSWASWRWPRSARSATSAAIAPSGCSAPGPGSTSWATPTPSRPGA